MLRPQEFLNVVRDRAVAALPPELQAPRSRIFYATLQLHYGNPRIHYEVWLVRKTGRIEVGLHFEDEREHNERAAAALAERVHDVRAGAGDDVELEQWTASWTRLHLTLPLAPLTDRLCNETADRLARLVRTAQPLLDARMTTQAGGPILSGARLGRGRFRRGSRAGRAAR